MDKRTNLRKRTKSLKRKKLVVGLSLATLGLGTVSAVVPNLTITATAETTSNYAGGTVQQLYPDIYNEGVSVLAQVNDAHNNPDRYTPESYAAFDFYVSLESELQYYLFKQRTDLLTDEEVAQIWVDNNNDPELVYAQYPDLEHRYGSEALRFLNSRIYTANYSLGLLVEASTEDSLNLDALRAAIQSSENLIETDYTTESWEVFNQALINATFVDAYVTNGETVPYTYTQADIDGFNNNLVNAINGLVEVTSGWEISELRTAYERYTALSEADYTPESWSQMYNDLNGVNNPVHLIYVTESVLNGTFSQDALTQDDINDIVSRINTAIDSLVLKESPAIPYEIYVDTGWSDELGLYTGGTIYSGDTLAIALNPTVDGYNGVYIDNFTLSSDNINDLNIGNAGLFCRTIQLNGAGEHTITATLNTGETLSQSFTVEEKSSETGKLPSEWGIDTSLAESVLNQWNSLIESDYTAESWNAMKNYSDSGHNTEGTTNANYYASWLNGVLNHYYTESGLESEGGIVGLEAGINDLTNYLSSAMNLLVQSDTESSTKTVAGGKITASSSTVKVGEPITLTYTISFSDGTTEEFNNFTVYKKGHSGDTSPIAIIDNGSWTPTEAGDYQLYGISPYGLYDDIIITVTEDTDSENPTNPSGDNTSNNDDTDSSTTPVEKDDKTTDNNNNKTTVSKNENNKQTTNETNSSKDTNSSKQNKEKDKTADELPKTGEHSSLALGFSGFGVILLALITWFRKRRKA